MSFAPTLQLPCFPVGVLVPARFNLVRRVSVGGALRLKIGFVADTFHLAPPYGSFPPGVSRVSRSGASYTRLPQQIDIGFQSSYSTLQCSLHLLHISVMSYLHSRFATVASRPSPIVGIVDAAESVGAMCTGVIKVIEQRDDLARFAAIRANRIFRCFVDGCFVSAFHGVIPSICAAPLCAPRGGF